MSLGFCSSKLLLHNRPAVVSTGETDKPNPLFKRYCRSNNQSPDYLLRRRTIDFHNVIRRGQSPITFSNSPPFGIYPPTASSGYLRNEDHIPVGFPSPPPSPRRSPRRTRETAEPCCCLPLSRRVEERGLHISSRKPSLDPRLRFSVIMGGYLVR